MGEELFVVVVEADLVPVQLAASSESRAGVLLSMGLALVESYVASCPSYSGFSSPSLLKNGSYVAATCAFLAEAPAPLP